MILKQIHPETVNIHDHTIAEIFCDHDGAAQAAILGRIAKTVTQWESWGSQCDYIAKSLDAIGMKQEVKVMLQQLMDRL